MGRRLALVLLWLCAPADAGAQAIPDLRLLDAETRQSLDLACIGARQDGPVAYSRCVNQQLDGLRNSPGMPDLSHLDNATRQSIQLACNGVKGQGPATYAKCLHQQVDTLREAPRMPEMPGMDGENRRALDLACIAAKVQGPAQYARCLQEQLDGLRSAPALPSLAEFDDGTRQSMQLACLSAQSSGPAAYRRCLKAQIDTLSESPGMPSLVRIDDATRESIELACRSDKAHGPVPYANCLRAQLKSIGVEPETSQARTPRIAPSAPAPSAAAQKEAEPSGLPLSPGAIAPWQSLPKFPMPAAVPLNGTGDAQSVYALVRQSVYLLVSAPSREQLGLGANLRQGSAVAISPTMALTNCHVLQGNRVHLVVRERMHLEVSEIFGDMLSDRCVLSVRGGTLVPVKGVRSFSTLAVGEKVYTIGSPSGLENTLAEGIVSGLRRKGNLQLVQSSAPISPGSSGGGLFDGAGNLIGITAFMRRDNPTFNFAIAADAYWR